MIELISAPSPRLLCVTPRLNYFIHKIFPRLCIFPHLCRYNSKNPQMRYLPFLIILLLSLNCFSQESKDMTFKVRKVDTTATAEESWLIIAEEMPTFPGGEAAMYKFLNSELSYPDTALARGIGGPVYVSFIVESDGSLSGISIYRGAHALLNEEAIRVVKKMPKWIPGEQRGKKVRVRMTLPIKFQLR